MPLYEFACECGIVREEVLSIDERNTGVVCDGCNKVMTRVVASHIERVEPTWLEDAVNHAVPHGSDVYRPRDRNEFNRYLKENKVDHVG